MAVENSKGFEFVLKVNHITSITPRQSGEMTSRDGENIAWGFAVKFKMHNIETVPDDDFGVKDVEVELEVTVDCVDLKQTADLNKALQSAKSGSKPFEIVTSLPNRDRNSYTAKSVTPASEIIKQLTK